MTSSLACGCRLRGTFLLLSWVMLGSGLAQGQDLPPGGPNNSSTSSPGLPILGLGPDQVPQDGADLRRTRNLIYGQELSEVQHATIDRWHPRDRGWWLDEQRHQQRVQILNTLERTIYQGAQPDPQSSLRSDPSLFGVELMQGSSEKGAEGPEVGSANGHHVVRIDAQRRPDLFSFWVALEAFSTESLRRHLEDPEAADAWLRETFARFIPETDLGLYQDEVDLYWNETQIYLRDLLTTDSEPLQDMLDARRQAFQTQDGPIDLSSLLDLSAELRHHLDLAKRRAGQRYLPRLGERLREGVTSYLSEQVLPNAEMTQVFPDRAVITEAADLLTSELQAQTGAE